MTLRFVTSQELEEDADMRSRVALFKDKQAAAGRAARPAPSVAATDDDDGDFPEVPLEELLDDLAGLQLDEAEEEAAIAAAAAAGELDGGDSGAEDMTE